MRKIIKTEGIIMGIMPYRESSAIFRLYTPSHGLLSCMAKGGRRPNSPYVGCLRTFVKGDFVLFYSERSEFYYLSECNLLSDPEGILVHEDRYLIASAAVELVIKISPVGVINTKLYHTLDHTLARLKMIGDWHMMFSLIIYFSAHALRYIGLLPPLDRCVICGSSDVQYFCIDQGGTLCGNHLTKNTKFDRPIVEALKELLKEGSVSDQRLLNQLFNLIFDYSGYHIGELQFATRLAIDRKRKFSRILE